MPLEDVLAMYGYGPTNDTPENLNTESGGSTSEEDILNNHDLTLDKDQVHTAVLCLCCGGTRTLC